MVSCFIKFFSGGDYAGAVVTARDLETAQILLIEYLDELGYAEVNISAVIEIDDSVGVKSLLNTNG